MNKPVNGRQSSFNKMSIGWQTLRLESCIDVYSGYAFRTQDFSTDNKDCIPVIKIGNLQNGLVVFDEKTSYVQKDFYNRLPEFQLHHGDVLIALSGATTGKIAVVNKDMRPVLVNQRVGKFRILDTNMIEKRYFYYLAQSITFKTYVLRNIGQSAQGNLSPNQIKQADINLPPLPEQRKISKILSTVDKAIEKVDEAIEKTERLKKGLMQELLTKGIGHKEFKDTEIGRIPKEWGVVQLEQVIKDIRNGFASGKRDENGIVQIRMNNVTTDGKVIFDSYLKVPKPDNINEWLLDSGDFLFNNTNSYDLVGKSAVFKESPFPCTYSNHFTRIKFNTSRANPDFMLYHFLVLWRKRYFKSVAIRHVGQSAVHNRYLLKLSIPLPSIVEQRKVVGIVSGADQYLKTLIMKKQKFEKIKKGLMNDLLTGKTRVKI